MDVLKLAMRYLVTRRIALVCVFSVMAGVAALIVVTSLMDGVQLFYRSTVKCVMADLWVRQHFVPPERRGAHFDYVRDLLRDDMVDRGGCIEALAPRLMGPAIIVRGSRLGHRDEESNAGIRINGIDFALERRLVPLDGILDAVKDPSLAVAPESRDDPFATDDHPGIILGDNLARRLGVARVPGPGTTDLVTVFSVEIQRDENNNLKAPERKMICRVTGCFSTGREDYDGNLAYMDRDTLRRLRFEKPRERLDATRIYVRLKEGADLDACAKLIKSRADTFDCVTWEFDNRFMLVALADQKRILVVILAFIVFVACAAILGLISMMVVEKVREIGILRSMGMSRTKVMMIFIIYGLMLATIGSGIGLALGLQLTANLDSVVSALSDAFGVELLNAEIYRFESVPTHVDPGSVTIIIAGVLVAALISSVVPALRAGLMTPLRCLRQE